MPAPRDGICGDAALYLLGLLETGDAGGFLAHAEECVVCREELGSLRPAVDVLGGRVPQIAAPAHVKRCVMSAVRAEARSSPASPAGSWWRWLAPGVGARRMALALLAVGLLAVGVAIGASSSSQRAGGSTRAVGAEVAIAGASAVLHDSGGREWLTIAGLPAPRRGHVYEVWVKPRGAAAQPTSILFSPTRAGAATVAVPGGVGDRGEVMVTQEPGGGSAQPTSAPVIVARL
jgi:Anti-sigma-K factor rskA